MLRGLGIPVIFFVIVLLVVNFIYVDYQLKALTYSYVNSIAREADNKLAVKVKEIEELSKVLATHMQEHQSANYSSIRKLLDNLLDTNEKYDIFIVRKPLVIEGNIQGDHRSRLRRRSFNDSDESKYLHYLRLAYHQNIWSQIRLGEAGWEASYIVPFKTMSDDTDGVVVVDVLLYDLVKNLFDIQVSENVKILLTMQQGAGTQTLLLSTQTSDKTGLSALDLSNEINIRETIDDMSPVFRFSANTASINDPLDGEGQTFISQLPSSFGPNMQLTALLPQEEVFMYIYRAKFIEFITVLIAFSGLVLLILLISKSISRPISDLTGKVEAWAAGNLNVRFPKTDSCVELNSLSNNLNKTVRQLKNYFSDLKRVTAHNEKINSEINISHNVQMSLLPHRKGRTEISGLDIHACTLPAKEVGGDFYYFFKIDRYRSALVIGDVSGKGMPAAIMMAVCLSLLKAQSANTPEPDICLRKINQFLMQEDTEQCIFITLFYALINPSNGELIYANAGHNPPFIARKDGGVERLDQEYGMALAVAKDVRYKTHKEKLNHGDMLLLYTDGITEAYNMEEEEFGEQRLIECLTRFKGIADTQAAKRCVQNIVRRIAQFIRGRVQFDDMTLLCAIMQESKYNLKRRASPKRSFDAAKFDIAERHNLQFEHRIAIRHNIREISNVIVLIDSFCRDYHVGDETAADLCVVVDELISNIICHNASDEGSKSINLGIAKQEEVLLIMLEYQGKAFDPLQISPPDIHEDWRKRRLGGLGIYISQQLADHISYTHDDGQNVLLIEKNYRTDTGTI